MSHRTYNQIEKRNRIERVLYNYLANHKAFSCDHGKIMATILVACESSKSHPFTHIRNYMNVHPVTDTVNILGEWLFMTIVISRSNAFWNETLHIYFCIP